MSDILSPRDDIRLVTPSSQGTVTCGTSKTLLVAANANRRHLDIIRLGANDVWVQAELDPAVDESYPLLSRGSVFTLSKEHMYQGAIYGIADGGTSDICFTEYE